MEKYSFLAGKTGQQVAINFNDNFEKKFQQVTILDGKINLFSPLKSLYHVLFSKNEIHGEFAIELTIQSFFKDLEELIFLKNQKVLIDNRNNNLSIINSLGKLQNNENFTIPGFSFELKNYKKPGDKVYVIYDNKIQICTIKNVFIKLSDFKEISNTSFVYPTVQYYEENLFYELETKEMECFETNFIFKRKSDIIKYISSLDNL